MSNDTEDDRPAELADSDGSPGDSSVVVGLLGAFVRPFERAVTRSRVAGAVATVRTWVRRSRLVRWFTAPPAQEEIVIDLRGTRLVGPAVRRGVRAGSALRRWSSRSALGRASAGAHRAVADDPRGTVGVVLAVALLTNLLVTAATGSLSAVGAAIRVALLAAVVAAVRLDAAWVRESKTARVVSGLFDPPE